MTMFETAEVGRKVSKEEYKAQVPQLRTELLDVQRELSRQARFPVVIVFAGVDGAGKSEMVNLLSEWMDPRWLVARAFGDPSDEERSRPAYWRYWQALPPRGRVGLFLSSWYSAPLLDRVHRRIKDEAFDQRLSGIATFEKELADDGALILKFWMHLGRDAQKKRLKNLERDPLTRWRVTRRQWKHWRLYDNFVAAAERAIQRTSTGDAPWTIIGGLDERYRSLAVATIIRDTIRTRLAEHARPLRLRAKASRKEDAARPKILTRPDTILSRLDMSLMVNRGDFPRQLEERQGRLHVLQRKAREREISTILVFEGWDAAGKAALSAASRQRSTRRRIESFLWPHPPTRNAPIITSGVSGDISHPTAC